MKNSTIKYKNNYLTNVLFKIEYKKIHDFNKNFVDEIINNLDGRFATQSSEEKNVDCTLAVSKEKQQLVTREHQVFIFYDSELKKQKISICDNYLALEFYNYSTFEEFKDLLSKIMIKFNELFQENIIAKIGLRYINQIRQNTTRLFEWNKILDKSLSANISGFFKNDSNISRSLTQTILNYDSYFMAFTYGIVNSDFPARIAKNEFLIDLDCFAINVQKQSVISVYLDKFHDQIQEYFEKSIKDDLRKSMGEIHE